MKRITRYVKMLCVGLVAHNGRTKFQNGTFTNLYENYTIAFFSRFFKVLLSFENGM